MNTQPICLERYTRACVRYGGSTGDAKRQAALDAQQAAFDQAIITEHPAWGRMVAVWQKTLERCDEPATTPARAEEG